MTLVSAKKRGMRRPRIATATLPLMLAVLGCPSGPSVDVADTSLLAAELPRGEATPVDGYTLFSPLRSTSIYLIDMQGEEVKRWATEYNGAAIYMLDNGNLLRGTRDRDPVGVFTGGGEGGVIQEIAWDGTVLWDFKYSDEVKRHHHDIAAMPNGNVLLIAWEGKTREEALTAGINPDRMEEDGIWPDFIVEIEPVLPDGGKEVWKWNAWDHLVQEHDPTKDNYGVVAEHPELIDINAAAPHRERQQLANPEELERLRALGYFGGGSGADADSGPEIGRDWQHTNGIDYSPELDQIVLSVRNFSEIWVIDHSTTTEEAAGHTGGRAGKGGDLLYRWGNPEAYGAGAADDRRLFVQHDPSWIPPGRAGAGNILVFNNGTGRAGDDGHYSSVDEIAPPRDAEGRYIMEPGRPVGPPEPVWSYTAEDRTSMYSPLVSGARRLRNGNTLICVGEGGRLREVGAGDEIVWEYVNPYDEQEGVGAGGRQGGPGPGSLFRAERVPADHPGVAFLRAAGESEGSG